MNNDLSLNDAWMTWQQFNKVIQGKNIIFFGVSFDWTEKTYAKSSLNLSYFVDNSPGWIGTKYNGIDVKNPEILKKRDNNTYVVITSGAYESICYQLLDFGLKPGIDFCMTPALNNLRIISEIHSHKATLLVSSPDHAIYSQLDKGKNIGGGLYTYKIDTFECEKVLDGTFHQIVNAREGYYVVDEVMGICHISKNFKLIDSFGLEQGGKPHGVAYCPQRNIVFIAQTSLDRVSAYDADSKKKLFDIRLSGKTENTGRSHHWMNDLHVRGDYLYISLFSISGCRMEGITDGGVLQVNIDDPSKRYVIMQNLWMPHTVRFFDSELCVLDSMNGKFYKTDKLVHGEFYGFIRGLGFDGSYYYIGQSETRYFDRLKGIKNNIGMSAGFYLFDGESKASKFFSIPQIHQVHDLCVISGDSYSSIH